MRVAAVGLEGRRAIVTGAGSGIGAAIARRLVADGARVLVSDVDEASAAALADELGPQASPRRLDVSSDEAFSGTIAWVLEEWGGLEVLVNNAGLGIGGTVAEATLAEFDHQVAVNLRGTFIGMHHAIPAMRDRGGGSIVNICSVAAFIGVPRIPVYAATKGAILALTRNAAIDHAHEGLRINCIAPGPVDTPLVERAMAAQADPAAALAAHVRPQPSGRMVAPEEIASMVSYLVSDEAASVIGAVMVIDGGRTAVWPT
jgi:NAD(P)-dependent dehydrogenase (short-subunit alcohol dehydrogenase family)